MFLDRIEDAQLMVYDEEMERLVEKLKKRLNEEEEEDAQLRVYDEEMARLVEEMKKRLNEEEEEDE